MAALDSLNIVRARIGERIAEIEERVARLKPVDICAKMEAIRAMAAEHGLAALEGLADYGAHHALMPGHVAATRACLEHMDEALMSDAAARPRIDPRRARGSPALGIQVRISRIVAGNARLLPAARRPCLHALAQQQAEADRRLSQSNARPRPRDRARRADRDARHSGGQAGRVRALAEERIDPVLLYMSRDYVGDMAETVSLLWPAPEGEPRELDDGTIRISDAVERLRAGQPSRRAARCSPRCSTISTRRAGSRCSSWRPARFASAFRRGSPSRRWPTPSGSMSSRSRRCGTG